MEENNLQQDLNIELNDDVAQGVYSNLVIISHSSSEFVLDFVRIMPGMPKAQVKTRTILTAEHAKRLLMALQDNIEKYEQHFGEIRIKDIAPIVPMPFSNSSNGQA